MVMCSSALKQGVLFMSLGPFRVDRILAHFEATFRMFS